jgi:riboflavin synthase alpha subunit
MLLTELPGNNLKIYSELNHLEIIIEENKWSIIPCEMFTRDDQRNERSMIVETELHGTYLMGRIIVTEPIVNYLQKKVKHEIYFMEELRK